jgi:hypothetical protein
MSFSPGRSLARQAENGTVRSDRLQGSSRSSRILTLRVDLEIGALHQKMSSTCKQVSDHEVVPISRRH